MKKLQEDKSAPPAHAPAPVGTRNCKIRTCNMHPLGPYETFDLLVFQDMSETSAWVAYGHPYVTSYFIWLFFNSILVQACMIITLRGF